MRKLLNIALAAALLGGAALATAAPAAAADWRGHDGWHERGGRGDRDDHWRDRDRDWRGGGYGGYGYGYGYGRDCATRWQWSSYWHRYVRVTRCY